MYQPRLHSLLSPSWQQVVWPNASLARRRAAPTRSRRRSRPRLASSTWTTTPSCWPTPGALLSSNPPGATDYVDADVSDTRTIVDAAARTLDLTQPTALILLGILGHVSGDEA